MDPNWNDMTALFGGAFDPPHRGHRMAVEGLFQTPGVKRVVVLPSAIPPLKGTLTSSEHRFEMAKRAFSDLPHVEVSNHELVNTPPDRPSYTLFTLLALAPVYGSVAFVVGTDQILSFEKWHGFPEILKKANWIILNRKEGESSLAGALTLLHRWKASGILRTPKTPSPQAMAHWEISGSGGLHMAIFPTPAPSLSSTGIRKAIAINGSPPEESLSPAVEEYARGARLYAFP